MKAMKKAVVLALAAMMTVFALCACGAPSAKTVETYYAQDSVKAQMDQTLQSTLEAMSSVYSKIGYTVSGNTMTYDYTFVDGIIDQETFNDGKDDMDANLRSQTEGTLIPQLHTETDVQDTVAIVYNYYTSDGSLLGSFKYEG